MPLTITPQTQVDDSGTGEDGTVFNVAWTRSLEANINALIANIASEPGRLVFPAAQNASNDPNTLDDYEEGSWTPVLGGAGGTSGQAYSTQVGRYVKIGQLVHVTAIMALSTEGTITGNARITGLPFVVGSAMDVVGQIAWHSLATSWVQVVARLVGGQQYAEILGATAAATSILTALSAADINNTTLMYFTGTYRASA